MNWPNEDFFNCNESKHNLALPFTFDTSTMLLHHSKVPSMTRGTMICCFCILSSTPYNGSWNALATLLVEACTFLRSGLTSDHIITSLKNGMHVHQTRHLSFSILKLACLSIFTTLSGVALWSLPFLTFSLNEPQTANTCKMSLNPLFIFIVSNVLTLLSAFSLALDLKYFGMFKNY